MADEAARNDRMRGITLAALAVMLLGVALRATTTYDPQPFWDANPLTTPTPVTSLTPAWGMLVDLIVAVAAGVVLVMSTAAGRAVPTWIPAAITVGGSVAALHAAVSPAGLAHAPRAMSWITATLVALASWSIASGSLRRLAIGVGLGLFAVVFLKGLLQVFVEHPAVVKSFERDQAAIFAARGWTPGSAAAEQYERRLRQPEASGWFGLSNVFASFAAAMAVAGGAAAVGAFRAGGRRWLACSWVGLAMLGVIGVGLSGSKGGIGAAALGLVLLAAAVIVSQRVRRIGVAVGLAAVVLPLAGLVVRAIIGDRIGELSLLFRSFYMRGAARIFADSPLIGVGPEGVQAAYTRVKPPLSAESVTSPHSLLLDWLATLGIGGVAWAAVFIAAAAAVGIAATRHSDEDTERGGADAPLIKLAALIAALAAIAGLYAERLAATPEAIAARFLGLAAVPACVWLGLRTPASALRFAVCGAALTLVAHGQIEMTPTRVTSAPWFGLLIGFGAAGMGSRGSSSMPVAPITHGLKRFRIGAAFVPALPALALVLALPPLVRWEAALNDGYRHAAPIGQATRELRRAQAVGDRRLYERALADLAALAARPGARGDPERLAAAAASENMPAILDALERAHDVRPAHADTARSLSRMLLDAAGLPAPPGDPPALVGRAIEVARDLTRRRPELSTAWGWRATVLLTAESMGLGPPEAASEAAGALERVSELDPRGPLAPFRLMQLHRQMGKAEAAEQWAAEAIRRDDLTRLDPLAGLTERQRNEAERIASD